MKVSNIIADIEYIVPKGTHDKYKYGLTHEQLIAQVDFPDFSGGSVANTRTNATFHESSFKQLQEQLKKPIANSMKLPEVETIGKG